MSDDRLFLHLKKVGIKSAKMISSRESLVIDNEGKGHSLLPSFFERYELFYNSRSGKTKVKKKGMIS